MKGERFFPDQPILSDDLSLAESSKEDALRERMVDLFTAGALEDSQLLGESIVLSVAPGSNNAVANPTITVATGVGYSPSGERIIVADAITYENPVVTGSTVTSGNPLSPDGTENGPLTTSDNGIGGFTLTPRSSGSVNIPLIQSATNRVWLGYLQTTDPAVFSLSSTTDERLFVKAEDGYEIKITTSALNPDSTKYFLLAEVTVTTTVLVGNISLVNRELSRTRLKRVGVVVDSALKPTTYADGSIVAIDDHINSVGSGTISPSNPHGVSASDLGIVDLADVGGKLNSSGLIVSSKNVSSSALFPVAVSSGTPEDNLITFKALSSSESVNVNGVIVTDSDIGSDVSFTFVDLSNVSIADGVYTFYIDRTTKQITRSLPDEIISDANKFVLTQITWTSPSLVLPPTDLRLFGTTATNNLRLELLGALSIGAASGDRVTTLVYDIDGNLSTATMVGDATVGATDAVSTYTYDIDGNLTDAVTAINNRVLTTTLTYNIDGDVDTITETVV